MADRKTLEIWIVDALHANSGKAHLVDIAKHIWKNHESDIRAAGDFFFVWQYDMRRAAETLRNRRVLKPITVRDGVWELA